MAFAVPTAGRRCSSTRKNPLETRDKSHEDSDASKELFAFSLEIAAAALLTSVRTAYVLQWTR